MSFFIRSGRDKSKLKGKPIPAKSKTNEVSVPRQSRKRKLLKDEEIESDTDSDPDSDVQESRKAELSSEEEEETAQEKKLRLTKQYLAQLEAEEADKEEDEGIVQDAIGHRLKQEQLEQAGRLHKEVADTLIYPTASDLRELRGHNLPVTCTVISPDSKFIFSGSKDCSLIKWSVETGKKVHTVKGGKKASQKGETCHTAHILSLAISSDGKYLASGDSNKVIHIWNPGTMENISTFTGHKKAISSLAFRKGSHQLFSASHDRSVKLWNCDEMAYVETLFGHQDHITGIDSLTRERAVTCGGRDRSVRVWKIIEESQLVFNAHVGCGSVDCVSLINESTFVTGADDNSISLWGVQKKKPLTTRKKAHLQEVQGQGEGHSNNQSEGHLNEQSSEKQNGEIQVQSSGEGVGHVAQSEGQQPSQVQGHQENWISSVISLQNTDLIASGSRDGKVRFWRCGPEFKSLTCIAAVPVKGFVNSLKFSSDGSFLVMGVGQEHRLGRWWRDKEARNAVVIAPLKKKS